MANTTYFGWETPDDTDLVKDGAAAIRTLGQAIDTSLQDLEGGTTGQILAKNSNTDMDFVWVTNDVGDITEVVAGTGLSGGGSSGSVTLTNTVATEFDAKGDLVVGTGADTFDKLSAGTNDHRLVAASGETTGLKYVADTQNTVIDAEGDLLVGDAADAVQRLAIGSNGNVLTVDTAVDGKIKWAAPAGGGKVLQVVQATFGTTASSSSTSYADTGLTANITPASASNKVLVMYSLLCYKTNGNSTNGINLRLLRDATNINTQENIYRTDTILDMRSLEAINYLDSPSTTSAITYKLQFANRTATSSVEVFAGNQTGTLILMEIGA